MKKIILSIIIFLTSCFSVYSHVNHYKDYTYLEYELFRNNKLIGDHKYNFTRNGNLLTVNSKVNFEIKKLGVQLYNYFAESVEVYENDLFSKFSSKTNQNDKQKYVNIINEVENNELLIDGSSFKGKASNNFIVGTWWNHEIIKAKAQISAISGRVIEQRVTFTGKETIKIGNKEYKTLRFNFKSADENLPEKKRLNTDIWYEEETFLWVKAAFDKTGYWEYRLKSAK